MTLQDFFDSIIYDEEIEPLVETAFDDEEDVGEEEIEEKALTSAGLTPFDKTILETIDQFGTGNLDDLFYLQNKERIVQLEHDDLIESQDTVGYKQIGNTKRTLRLTPRGRLALQVSKIESMFSKHLPGLHDQRDHGRKFANSSKVIFDKNADAKVYGRKIRVYSSDVSKVNIFDSKMSDADLLDTVSKLSGAIANESVAIDPPDRKSGYLSVSTFGTVYSQIKVYKDRLVIDDFSVSKARRGKGIGTEAFKQILSAAKKLGIKHIIVNASRYQGAGNIGYYFWAKLGANGRVPADLKREWKFDNVDSVFTSYETVGDIMKTQSGRDFWKKYGSDFNGIINVR